MKAEIKVIAEKEMSATKSKNLDALNEIELNALLKAHFDNEQKMLDIKKKYADEFKKVLPLKKVVLLGDAENEFERELLKYSRERQSGGPRGNGPKFFKTRP